LEARIMDESKSSQIFDIRAVKVNLMRVRRAVWPMRDAILNMTNMDQVWGADLRPYLRDATDHIARLMDLIETDRMMASDLMELYLNSASNRLGEVNKFLTVVATIFIPVGAIASIYGMNFDMEKSAWNMPELKWTYGYPFALGLMLTVAATFLIIFWRRGWLGNQFQGHKRKRK
jgi:magnesium transporter